MKRRQFLQTSVAAAVAASLPGTQAFAEAVAALGTVKGDITAVSGTGAEVALQQADVQDLADSLRGQLLLPGSADYEVARKVLNASIDRYPALVVRPTGAADISSAVNFARERDLLLAVKCGGHSFSGKSTCQGGLQIDLSTFRNARVDADSRTAYIAGGSFLGELDHETMAQGLVTTSGTVSHTGVGGLTLGGGFGRLARRYGLALDNVKAVDIITADGQLRHASAEDNPDLYWGVRGGGGNFGVVTSFEFNLHPMEREVVGGDVVYPLSEARNVLKFYADYTASCPDELYLDLVIDSQPGSSDGVMIIHACWSGPKDQAAQVLSPIPKAGKVLNDGLKAIDYVAIQASWDNTDPRVNGEYLKSGFVSEINGKLIDTIIDGFQAVPERGVMMIFQHSGGEINRRPADETAFSHRSALANMLAVVSWPLAESRDTHVRYIKDYWGKLEPFTHGWYSNEVSDESVAVVNKNYQGNYQRLVQVKNRYDPGNLFRLNANIQPTV